MTTTLSLGLAKAMNARDLGGAPAGGGRHVRRGILFRSDSLHRLSADDQVAVGALGLACVIDLRSESEVARAGSARLPASSHRLVSLPLHDPAHAVFVSVHELFAGSATIDDLDGAALMEQLYRWFVTSELATAVFREAVRVIADPSHRPLLYHCAAGKDRTGWLSALILSALGVDRDLILADYLRTNEFNRTANEFLLGRFAARMSDPSVVMPVLEARPEYLEAAFDQVRRDYGSMDTYLAEAIGVPPTFREALLTPS